MKLLLRFVIFVLVGLSIFSVVSRSNPFYTVNDLYLVRGYCIDIQYEEIYAKNGDERVYVVTDDGERYYIYDYLWKTFDETQRDIIGNEIVFFASDKAKFWHFDHILVAFGQEEENCLASIKLINNNNTVTKVLVLSGYCVFFSLIYLAPEVFREMDRREQLHSKKRKMAKRNTNHTIKNKNDL